MAATVSTHSAIKVVSTANVAYAGKVHVTSASAFVTDVASQSTVWCRPTTSFLCSPQDSGVALMQYAGPITYITVPHAWCTVLGTLRISVPPSVDADRYFSFFAFLGGTILEF